MTNKYYLTTAIYYANNAPHIGTLHEILWTYTLSTILKLFCHDVFLLTGMDEHGDKVYNSAIKHGKTPREWVDEKAEEFSELFKSYGISWDRFIRTTDEDHKIAVHHFWKECEKNGYLYKGSYSGYYSEKEEAFFTESELIDGKSPEGGEVKYITEECWFLKLSALQDKVEEFLNSDITIPENKVNEMKGFMKDGLRDLCISREFGKWGIDVPGDKGKIYVWFDALTNYLTACGYPNLDKKWENAYHVIGKDIAIFHGIYWPAMLFAANIKPFKKLLIHNWWLLHNSKMSKSLGNVVNPKELREKYPLACLKFYLLNNALFGKDCDFDEMKMVEDYNSIVVKKFSNLVYRVQVLLTKNQLPMEEKEWPELKEKLHEYIKKFDIYGYINELLDRCQELNQEIDHKQIWNNPQDGVNIFSKIMELIKYFDPVIGTKHFNKDKPQHLFNCI